MTSRTEILMFAASCDEMDAWTDEIVGNFGWLAPTEEDVRNVRSYRTLTAMGDVTVGYLLH